MDGLSLNHYEEQLYSMFKSFDVNNEEALDERSVHELCDALQLEERGAALVDTLFQKNSGRVTFARFRSGLLAVLGDEAPATQLRPPEPPPAMLGDEAPAATPPAPAPAEVEPRFVFGSKRYGRRSRPAQAEPGSPRAASTSRLDASRGARATPRARRSASAVESRVDDAPALEHDTRIDGEKALALCNDLRMNAIDRRIIERIFEDSPGPDTTVGEFFERLDSTLARALGGASDEDAHLTAERLIEEWERAGVRRPRRLLAELGFTAPALSAAELERALDSELGALGEALDERTTLLTAALALARTRAAATRRRAGELEEERDKLRADVAEANARAALLARDVDDSHARIEGELKDSLRRAEARHAEDVRRARSEAEAEGERWGAERARLEVEVSRRGDAEARLRVQYNELAQRSAFLEERVTVAEAALEASRGERLRLQECVAAAEERAQVAAEREEQAAQTSTRLAALAREHRCLQDRADELATALEEARTTPTPALPAPLCATSVGSCDANLSAELGALLELDTSKEVDEETSALKTACVEEDGAGEPARLREHVKELEAALDAMRCEYDACEEYWTSKQRTEREAHDAELRAADTRLAALLARVADFERRLAPPAPSLHAIPEAPALEAQVAALEAECAAAARDAAARLQRAHEQLARAQRRLAALQRRRASPPPAAAPPAPCARCRRLEAGGQAAGARALRAEESVRRLQARLLAADVLVKELYVENCQLSRLPP